MTKRFIVLFGLMMSAAALNAEPLVDGDVEAGKQKSATCAACHGPQGNMESAQFPKLAGQGSPYLYHQLKMFKSGVRQNAVMAGQVAALSEQDMKDLAAFYAAQQMRPGVADEVMAPAGAVLYHAGNAEKGIPACAGCHGPAGVGNAAALYPRLSGQSSPYVAAQLTAYRGGKRSGYRNATIMNGVAENLTDKDIKALASYVAGLSPAPEGASNDKGALMQNVSAPAPAQGSGEGSSEQAQGQSQDQNQGQTQSRNGGQGEAEGNSDNATPADSNDAAADSQQDAESADKNAQADDAPAAGNGDSAQSESEDQQQSAADGGANTPSAADDASTSGDGGAGNASAQSSGDDGSGNSGAKQTAQPDSDKGSDGAAAANEAGNGGSAAESGDKPAQDSSPAESAGSAADSRQDAGGEDGIGGGGNASGDSRSKEPAEGADDASQADQPQ